jgi:hypothetical protein
MKMGCQRMVEPVNLRTPVQLLELTAPVTLTALSSLTHVHHMLLTGYDIC